MREIKKIPTEKLKECRGTRENIREAAAKILTDMRQSRNVPESSQAPVRTISERAAPTSQRASFPAPAATSYVYGDGNLCEVGDLVMKDNTLAEVTLIAGNGIVLDIPAEGKFVVQGADLLGYSKVANKNVRK